MDETDPRFWMGTHITDTHLTSYISSFCQEFSIHFLSTTTQVPETPVDLIVDATPKFMQHPLELTQGSCK